MQNLNIRKLCAPFGMLHFKIKDFNPRLTREPVEVLDYRGSKQFYRLIHDRMTVVLTVELSALPVHEGEIYLLIYLVEKVVMGNDVSIYLFRGGKPFLYQIHPKYHYFITKINYTLQYINISI